MTIDLEELRVIPSDPPGRWYFVRATDSIGPLQAYPEAAKWWRRAKVARMVLETDRRRFEKIADQETITTLEDWTVLHGGGLCAGDEAGCLHCRDIADRFSARHATYDEVVILGNRKNLAAGFGQYVMEDPGMLRRAASIKLELEGRDHAAVEEEAGAAELEAQRQGEDARHAEEDRIRQEGTS